MLLLERAPTVPPFVATRIDICDKNTMSEKCNLIECVSTTALSHFSPLRYHNLVVPLVKDTCQPPLRAIVARVKA